ncbi:glycoside hydrolase family 57 protein [Mucisphaera calidilacus]|uniref:Glycosyl hydrolase family 57 n=1 Tax=Mucisphaera calidilacus TaxID=2527982 RepID=A0A518BXD1_9BACT|nr:glycoside hydrolase family 57 protein [Mucisphaera calidilacus]QDU71640.1 Glycosyl hydrolase family 57 [Mucisphaera calidilacus]
MPSVCLYFQVHQPERLRRYSVFDAEANYFDPARNAEILRKVAAKCYLPATQVLLEQINRHDGAFRVAFSLTGTIIEQFQQYAPDVIDRFRKLAETGCVEFLAETANHSLAFLYSRDEFMEQVEIHADLVDRLFNQRPTVFRNTELIYNNDLAAAAAEMGFRGVIAEGADGPLNQRTPNNVYRPPHGDIGILLKNYKLSDDIAFRFSNTNWAEYPLTAAKMARWIHQLGTCPEGQQPPPGPAAERPAQLCNLFMDFETFGEHQWSETGIFEFLREFPKAVLETGDTFMVPTEAVDAYPPDDVYDCPQMTSWADSERDLSAWVGNAMQSSALHELYRLGQRIKEAESEQLLALWRRLTTSDHFYYMATKYHGDAAVHDYFSPYQSPYDAYINFMNVLDNLRARVEAAAPAEKLAAE